MPSAQDIINAHSRDLTRLMREHEDLKRRIAALEQRSGPPSSSEQVVVEHFNPAIDPILTVESDGDFEEEG